MPDLDFQVEAAEAARFAASPMLIFKLRISNQDAAEIVHSVALRCQIQIEATQRRYDPDEREKLTDIFGSPERWNQTLRNMLWTHTTVIVPPFQGSCLVDLPVPCTFDF